LRQRALIQKYRATISFTSPTAYRTMLAAMDKGADLSSLRAGLGRRDITGSRL
jgi:2-aminobenzoate-CoA ligase